MPEGKEAELGAMFEEKARYHPAEAHWYLTNINLHQRHGFEVRGAIQVGSLPLFPMLRAAR